MSFYAARPGNILRIWESDRVPIAAILLGSMLLDLAFRGTEHQFAKQLGQDFGQGSKFLSWVAAIVILGAIGYVPALRTVSTAALTLLIVVLTLANGGFFQQAEALVTSPPAPYPAISLSSYSTPTISLTGGSSSSGSNPGGWLGGIVGGQLFGPAGQSAGTAAGNAIW